MSQNKPRFLNYRNFVQLYRIALQSENCWPTIGNWDSGSILISIYCSQRRQRTSLSFLQFYFLVWEFSCLWEAGSELVGKVNKQPRGRLASLLVQIWDCSLWSPLRGWDVLSPSLHPFPGYTHLHLSCNSSTCYHETGTSTAAPCTIWLGL